MIPSRSGPTLGELDAGRLIGELRRWGISFLMSEHALAADMPPLSTQQLIEALAQHNDPRVRNAFIPLLMLHPEFADTLDAFMQKAPTSITDEVITDEVHTLLLATLYLQRKWYPALTFAMGKAPSIPECRFIGLWREWQLAAPSRDFGTLGLWQLERKQQEIKGLPLAYQGDWEDQVLHLISQEWPNQHPGSVIEAISSTPPWSTCPDEHEGDFMSMRPQVTRADIERFLHDLGKHVLHSTGRLYLVGGAALVHNAIRGMGASTADIDLTLDVSDQHEVEHVIRLLITQLQMNIEFASPGDFIPLPPSWEASSRFVGRYGQLDVFYFDYYSLALAKIARSQARDLHDIQLLAQQGWIQRQELEAACMSILPLLGTGRYFNIDPVQYCQKFAATVALLWPTP